MSPNEFEKRYNLESLKNQVFIGSIIVQFVGDIPLVSINSDAQALHNSKIPHKLQIGEKITGGRGAGMKPEIGKKAALESYDEIKEVLSSFEQYVYLLPNKLYKVSAVEGIY